MNNREQIYEEYKQKLIDAGYKIFTNNMKDGDLPYYACRTITNRVYDCCCNKKQPLYWFKFYSIRDYKSVDVELCGQLKDGKWIRVKRNIGWDDLLDEYFMKKLDKMLSAAYNAAYESVLADKIVEESSEKD